MTPDNTARANRKPYVGRSRLLAYALAFPLAAAACAQPAPASQEAAGVDTRQLFAQACAKCHGADGTGGLAMAANGPRPIDLGNAAWQATRSDEEIVAAIRDGRGAMPPFTGVLTPQQVTELARHVRSLSRP